MNETLTNKIFEDFPRLFRNRHETSMQRGFECGDGWFDLAYKLSIDIEAVEREVGLDPELPEWPLCRQVKLKLGGLHFYVLNCPHERVGEPIEAAYEQSCKTCEY